MNTLELCFTKPYNYGFARGKLMKVSVRGAQSTLFRRHLKWAAEFYASKLMTKRMIESLSITVILKNGLDDGNDGICSYEDHEDGIRYFEIEIDSTNSERQILLNLAHEMVHVKQFSLGELKDGLRPATTVWQGVEVDDNQVDYWDTPWEIEAHGREKGLFTRFKQHYGLMDMYKRPTHGDG